MFHIHCLSIRSPRIVQEKVRFCKYKKCSPEHTVQVSAFYRDGEASRQFIPF